MSPPAIVTVALLAIWMVASIGYTCRVPGLHDRLKRCNWFRTFAHWTMFAAHPDPKIRPGTFVIEFRDTADGAWTVAIDGHHWSPHSALLSPRRFIAARAHYLGQAIAAIQRTGIDADGAADIRHRERTIAAYLRRTFPLAPGKTRAVRVVKRFGRAAPADEEVTWQFTVSGHA